MFDRNEAAQKVTRLQQLAAGTNYPHEAEAATKIAEAIIAKYELTRAEVRCTRPKPATKVTTKLRHLREQVVAAKLWLAYAGHASEAAAMVAQMQAMLEQCIAERVEREKRPPTRAKQRAEGINTIRSKYL